jgi:hypothetical protein
MTSNLVVQHSQELVAAMQPFALKNKLLKKAVEG